MNNSRLLSTGWILASPVRSAERRKRMDMRSLPSDFILCLGVQGVRPVPSADRGLESLLERGGDFCFKGVKAGKI